MSVPPLELSPAMQGYQPPLSLWQLVEELVSSHEQEEIKRILGESLIDQSIELHEEVSTLQSIWQDYKMETIESEHPKALPEPPQQRERLVQEISFFVANVKDKANSRGLDHEHLFSRHNSCVIEYALETSQGHCSNAHLRSPVTDETTSRVVSPQNSIPFQDLSEEMLRMRNKLNYLQLDDVVQHLRLTLQDEIEQLLQDITFLQHQLDDEVSIRMTGRPTIAKEPTLTELKEERAALEKELLTHTTVPASPPNRPTFVSKPHLRLQSSSTMAGLSQPINNGGKVLFSSSDYKWKNVCCTPVKAQHKSSDTGVACSSASPDCGTSSPVSLRDIAVLDRPLRKRSISPSRVKVLPVGRISSPGASPLGEAKYIPTPPTKQVANRPSSADRFRKLVLDCRDGT